MKSDNPDDRTILSGSDPEFIADLSEYLDVLASPVRLHILSFIGTKPRTVRQIAHEIETSYENTKKHLLRLFSLGLVQKDIGISDESVNQGQPVFYYTVTPGSLNHAVQNLAIFTSVTGPETTALSDRIELAKKGLLEILPGAGPVLSLTSGPENGRRYNLTGNIYRIGRNEEGWDGLRPEPAILLGDEYRSVSRVSRPHAWLKKQSGVWTINDGNSKGGTYVNGTPVSHDPVILKDEDLIELSPGSLGAALLFQSGKS
jgi:DNA-binding transcriptional ArsR family regulator